MPEKRRVSKEIPKQAFYIDTNVALDYVIDKDKQTVSVLENIKKLGVSIVSSSFLIMEAADYVKNNLYINKKSKKRLWDIKQVIRKLDKKNLKEEDFESVSELIEELKSKLELELFDFLVDSDTWELGQYISQSSNLYAPDVIHLASAIVATQSGIETGYGIKIPCDIFISNDGFLRKEGEKIKEQLGIPYPDILAISEVKKRFLKKDDKGKKNG